MNMWVERGGVDMRAYRQNCTDIHPDIKTDAGEAKGEYCAKTDREIERKLKTHTG